MKRKREALPGKCRLCLADPVMLKRSHILPKFHYKPCRGKDNEIRLLSGAGPRGGRVVRGGGFWEFMLCGSCEGLLNRWETYANGVLFWSGSTLGRIVPEGFEIKVDYSKFKLYALSILWRMSISSRPEFKNVSLGAIHEETLRSAILAENPLSPNEYPLMLTAFRMDGQFFQDVIIPPIGWDGGSGDDICRVVMNGLIFCFIVRWAGTTEMLEPIQLSTTDTVFVRVADISEIPFLDHYFREGSKVW